MTIKKAFIDVQNTLGLAEFATQLVEMDIKIFAYCKTAKYLKTHKIPFSQIEHNSVDGWNINEPTISDEHIIGECEAHRVDLYVGNVPDIESIINIPGVPLSDVINNIDTTSIKNSRLAAVNFLTIIPVINNQDYDVIINDIQTGKLDDMKHRLKYAQKVFGMTSKYDSIVSQYLYINSF